MSIRSIRACDYSDCNAVATLLCPLCERDCCATHANGRWIAWAALSGTNGTREDAALNANSIGASRRILVCSDCYATLALQATAPGFRIPNGPLNAAIPSNELLIAAARAYVAEAKLAVPE